EAQIADPSLALAQVARHPRLVVDQRETPADEPVEERGLADVRPPDDGKREGHGRSLGASPAARKARQCRAACRPGMRELLAARTRVTLRSPSAPAWRRRRARETSDNCRDRCVAATPAVGGSAALGRPRVPLPPA